jgi:hypothetical protein
VYVVFSELWPDARSAAVLVDVDDEPVVDAFVAGVVVLVVAATVMGGS